MGMGKEVVACRLSPVGERAHALRHHGERLFGRPSVACCGGREKGRGNKGARGADALFAHRFAAATATSLI